MSPKGLKLGKDISWARKYLAFCLFFKWLCLSSDSQNLSLVISVCLFVLCVCVFSSSLIPLAFHPSPYPFLPFIQTSLPSLFLHFGYFLFLSLSLSLPCSLDSLPTSVYLVRFLFPFLPRCLSLLFPSPLSISPLPKLTHCFPAGTPRQPPLRVSKQTKNNRFFIPSPNYPFTPAAVSLFPDPPSLPPLRL